MKDLSIIIPIYNSEKSIERLITSVKEQKINLNYEIIIINDGSTDSSETICQKIERQYSDVIYKRINNSGVSAARNLGIKLSKGKYIMFADSDDYYTSEGMNNILEKLEDDIDLIITSYKRINANGKDYKIKRMNNKIYEKEEFGTLIEKAQNNNMFNQIWNKIYRKDIIENNNIVFEDNMLLGEDYRFNLKYIQYTKRVKVVDRVMYNYINSDTGLNLRYTTERLEINLENLKILKEFFEKNNYNMDYIENKYFITIISGINNICKNEQKKFIKENLKKLCNNIEIKQILLKTNKIRSQILYYILDKKRICIMRCIGILANKYEKIYRKIKLGY